MAIFSKEMCRQKLNTWLAAEEDMAPTAVRFERWPGPFLLCGEVDKSAADRYF